MEDFIERVGQSYLERKAFAVPQQLENFAKKQFTGGDEKEAEAKKSTGKKATEEEEEGEDEEERTTNKKGTGKRAGQTSSGSLQKDKEIARLKKQLAQSKLENAKAPHEKSASGLKKLGVSRASNGQKAFTSKAARGNKETTKSAALGAVAAVGGRHGEKKSKSGEKEASGSTLAKEANIVEASPTKRRTSASQYRGNEGGGKSEHGAGSKSDHGGHAKSTTSHAAAASDSKRRPSAASQSEHGRTAKSIAPAPVHKHFPAHAERLGGARAVVESRRPKRREERERERDLYAVEVVEEVPRGERKDAGGVVEVETSKGRTLYRVR